jgi:beta-1,4-mannosyl-glycoprotein beta-1,4-N-acetylglucosaminyltransferase
VEGAVALTKVLDAFLFTHEFDLLELRLRALWPVVDKFLMVEGDHNFTNQPKALRFNEQKDRFAWAADKLCVVQNIGKLKDYSDGDEWPPDLFVEHQHRQFLYEEAKRQKGFEPTDILLISDIDEIPSREVINKLKNDSDFPSPILCNQDFYYYNIKCHRGKRWHGTMAMRFGYKLGSVAQARNNRVYMPKIESQCGWHFAHFYDSDGIREKLLHSSHSQYNLPEYYNKEHLARCVAENKSYIGKKDGTAQPEPIPYYMLEELKRFPIFMGDEWR